MKKLLLSLFLAGAITSSVFAMSYDDASKLGKPVVVMFHMHGCGACKKFTPLFDRISSGSFAKKFSFVKEDTNASAIGKTLNFQTVPAVFIIQPKTMAAKRIDDDCAWDEACFAKTLQEYN